MHRGLLLPAVLFMATLLVGCADAGAPPVAAEAPAARRGVLTVEPDSWDFGAVDQTQPQTATLSARNDGTEPVRLLSLDGT